MAKMARTSAWLRSQPRDTFIALREVRYVLSAHLLHRLPTELLTTRESVNATPESAALGAWWSLRESWGEAFDETLPAVIEG